MTALGDFSSGDVLTAADLNAIGTWTSFTPSFTNFTLGNGTIERAIYSKVNELVFVQLYVTLGSTSSMGTSPSFTAPVGAADSSQLATGVGRARISSSFFWIFPYMSDDDVIMYCVDAASSYARRATITSSVPATWGSGSDFQINMVYQA